MGQLPPGATSSRPRLARIHRTEWGGRWNRTSQGWRGDLPGGYGAGGASSRPVAGERSRS